MTGGSPNLPFLLRRATHAVPWLMTAAIVGLLAVFVGSRLSSDRRRFLPANHLLVTVVNVGHGEAAWARSPGGKFVVIGGGPPGAGDQVADSLRQAGANRIALLVLPYPYAEAIGGVPELLTRFPVDAAVESQGAEINRWQTQVRALLDAKKVPLHTGRAGDVWEVDGVRIEALGPPAPLLGAPPVAANNSLVLRMSWRDSRFLWCGGLERRGEVELLSTLQGLSVQWLRVAHFGTREASSPEFLRLVSPEFAVVSVGPNRSGYPHPETLRRLHASGARVYRTDSQPGNLRFVSDGKTITGP